MTGSDGVGQGASSSTSTSLTSSTATILDSVVEDHDGSTSTLTVVPSTAPATLDPVVVDQSGYISTTVMSPAAVILPDPGATGQDDSDSSLPAAVPLPAATTLDPTAIDQNGAISTTELGLPSNQPTRSFSDLAGETAFTTPRISRERKRKVAHAEILTGSPYKKRLEASLSAVQNKSPAQQGSRKKGMTAKKPIQSKPTSKEVKRRRKEVATVDGTPCLFCEIPYYKSSVQWWQCSKCLSWVCGNCACITTEACFHCGC